MCLSRDNLERSLGSLFTAKGAFSQDLSPETKLLRSPPSGIVSEFLGAALPSSCEVLISLLSQTYLLAAFFLPFSFLPRPVQAHRYNYETFLVLCPQ